MSPKRRITIGRLLAAIGLCALIFAAIRSGQDVAASAIFALAVVALLCASLAALLRRGRPFWIGFAVFGWASLVLSFGPWSKECPVPRPITTYVLQELYPYVGFESSINRFNVLDESLAISFVAGGMQVVAIAYLQIGHSILALIVAGLGGFAVRRMARRPTRD